MKANGRTIPRGRGEFAEVREAELRCVVVSGDNDYREVERPVERAWELLDGDPKARLLDLGDGTYMVVRRPWPLWYVLTRVPGGETS